MYVQRIEFGTLSNLDTTELTELASNVLGTFRMNGQVCGKEWPMYFDGNSCNAIVLTPEVNSLETRFNNDYVSSALEKLKSNDVSFNVVTIGKDAQGAEPCNCKKRTGYVLFTNFLSIESSVKCLKCFAPVPLYKLPRLASGEYYELLCWQSDYQNCDHLQMNCSTLERSATKQISDVHSNLTLSGKKICSELAELTGLPVFYYLYRASGRSLSSEQNRRCPSCGEPWYLLKPLHSFLNFKCDRCYLVSNIGWNVQYLSS